MPQNPAPPQDSNSSQSTSAKSTSGSTGRDAVQGEGDYEAARRYRDEVKEYLERSDVDERAHAAKPDSAKQERELALAEEQGKTRSKGDDPADVGLMYPGRKPEETSAREERTPKGDKR